MRVAIAGAAGLVGHGISRVLSDAGHTVVSIGRRSEDDVHFDLARPRKIAADELAGCELLVHAAGVTDEDFADPEAARRKASAGAEALAEAAERAGLSRLAYISSAHVYGPLSGLIDETRAPDPRSEYARGHLATEEIFTRAAARYGAALLIARPCAVFGMPVSLERFARWSLIPFDFPRQALAGEIVLRSTGLQRRNFVSAKGLAHLVGWWLGTGLQGRTIANAPGPHELSVYDFACLCARIVEGESGRPVIVRRPEGSSASTPPAGLPLEYRTRVGGHLPGTDLEDHIRALARALSKKKESP